MPYIARIYNNDLLHCGLPHILSVIHQLAKKEELAALDTLGDEPVYCNYQVLKRTFASCFQLNHQALTWQVWDKFLSQYSFYEQQLLLSAFLRDYLMSQSEEPIELRNDELNHEIVDQKFFKLLGISIDILQYFEPGVEVLKYSSFNLDQQHSSLNTHITIYRKTLHKDRNQGYFYDLEREGASILEEQAVQALASDKSSSLWIIHSILCRRFNHMPNVPILLSGFVRKKIQSLFPQNDCRDTQCINHLKFLKVSAWQAKYMLDWDVICEYLEQCSLIVPHKKLLYEEKLIAELAKILRWMGKDNPILKNSDIVLSILKHDKAMLLQFFYQLQPAVLKNDERFYAFIFRDWNNVHRIATRLLLLGKLENAQSIPDVFHSRSGYILRPELIYDHAEPELLLAVIHKLIPQHDFADLLPNLIRMDGQSLDRMQTLLANMDCKDITPSHVADIIEALSQPLAQRHPRL